MAPKRPYMQLGASRGEHVFCDVTAEFEPRSLSIEGTIPEWLAGTFIRNGPARFDFPGEGSVSHWFDGLSYLQRFTFSEGVTDFSARFTRSETYKAAVEGRRPYEAFGTAPAASLKSFFGRFGTGNFTDNPNVNVARYGDAAVALTEVGLPRCFDPKTLETLGSYAFTDAIGTGYTTAHPVFARGKWINYTLKFGATSRYIVWSLDPSGARTQLAAISSKRPSYVHSIGLSQRFAVLVEYPFVVNPLELLFGHKPFIENFRWNGGNPALFHLIDLDGGQDVVTIEGEPFFSFHHIHAFDDGDDTVVDLVGYDTARIVGDLTIATLRAGGNVDRTGMGVRRYRLSRSRRTAKCEPLTQNALRIELPRLNPRAGIRPRYYYGPRFTGEGFSSDAICRLDTLNGTVLVWNTPDQPPGEAIFVARPWATAEDDGVLLTTVIDPVENRSAMIVLDAQTMRELARAWTPGSLPLGFHSQFFRT